MTFCLDIFNFVCQLVNYFFQLSRKCMKNVFKIFGLKEKAVRMILYWNTTIIHLHMKLVRKKLFAMNIKVKLFGFINEFILEQYLLNYSILKYDEPTYVCCITSCKRLYVQSHIGQASNYIYIQSYESVYEILLQYCIFLASCCI